MANIKLKRGYDLKLKGHVTDDVTVQANPSASYAVVPDDFEGVVPRMEVKEGDSVLAGGTLYHDKTHEAIKVTSPVAGIVKEVRRGERRKIEAIVIEPAAEQKPLRHDTGKDAKTLLLDSGLWAMLRQRPYDVVPSPDVRPRDIFVTCFDSAPLAPSLMATVPDTLCLQAGVALLRQLTDGQVYLGFRPGEEKDVPGAVVNTFAGPHPAGNAGVQLANVKPVNKGEVVWTLDVVTLARIGKLAQTGVVDFTTTVAVTGESVTRPRLFAATMGCTITSLLGEDDMTGQRVISGNALTGVKVAADGWLRAPYRHITVIPEVSEPDEFMGWASLSPKRFSIYHLFTSWLTGNKKPASFDARVKGGERAIVRLDEYDRMLPMDIYGEFLIKAIISGDIDKMEQLGIYEVAPEDFALAEFADTSKLELQRIVREGLNKLRSEME